jgi:hypothetical protein
MPLASLLTVVTTIALHAQVVPGDDASTAAVSALATTAESHGRAQIRLPGVGPVTLSLRPMRAVAPDAVVETGTERRAVDPALTKALHGVRHYEGTVDGLAGSSAYVAVGSTGVAAMVDLGEGRGLFALRRIDSEVKGLCTGPSAFVRIGALTEPEVDRCRCLDAAQPPEGGTAGVAGSLPPGGRRVVEMAVDSDNEYYVMFPSATALTEYTAALVGEVSSIYRRDCDAGIVVSYLRVQPNGNDLFNQNDPLDAFREYWTVEGAAIDRDLFTLFTGRRNLPYGGVAYLSTACSPEYGYSINGYLHGTFVAGSASNPGNWDVNVVAHEFGHNLGTLHTHDYGIDGCASGALQRGTIMSYCHVLSGGSANIDLHFHRGTVARIESFMASAPCLSADCDDDGVPDQEQIAADPKIDLNADGIIDACQDCDADGINDRDAIRGSKSRWVGSADDALLRELDARSGVLHRTVVVGDSPITDLVIGGDGRMFASAGNQVWSVDRVTGAPATPWGPPQDAEVRSVAVAPDGRVAAMLATGRIMLISQDGASASQFAEAFSGDDARDLVFRRLNNGSNEAFASTGAGVIHKFTWPSGARTPFADLTADAPGLRGMYPYRNNTLLVAASALNGVYRVSNAGELLGRWDVQGSGLTNAAYAIADARDGRSIVVTSPVASSSVNGYDAASGRMERALRSYPADAPAATAIVIAPASETDRNGNLVPDACEPSVADLNGDGRVDGADLGLLLLAWGECGTCSPDFDGDGRVNGADLGFLLGVWGQ